MIYKDGFYYPSDDFKNNANIKDESIYKKAQKDPIKFWEDVAGELFWYKKWSKGFERVAPSLKWFVNGKINITSCIFENNIKGWENIKNKVALIWEPENQQEETKYLTYSELYSKVNKFANALKNIGVKKGDVVAIYMPMIPEIIISMLACARIGAVHSVVFSAFSPKALNIRLQDTKAKVLITSDGYYRRGKVINLKQQADEGLEGTEVEKVIIAKRTGNEISVISNRDLFFDDILEKADEFTEAEVMDSEDLQFILYTSGSTGKPKGCEHVCGGYTVYAYWTGKAVLDLKESDILWCTSDPGWITGHTYVVYSPLLNGATTLMFEGAPDYPTPDRWAQIIEKHKVTIFYTAPTAIRMFMKEIDEKIDEYKFETLRLLGSVGEPINEEAWIWFFEKVGKKRCPVVDTWWQTELGGIAISSLPGIGPFKPTMAGRPLPGVKVKILDDEGNELKAGEEGNLVIEEPFVPSLLRNVHNNTEKYIKTYWSQYGEKIYFSGDGAYMMQDGMVRIIGRVDDVIKVAGHRFTTGEFEDAITKHKDIVECAVVGVPDEIKGFVPVVFVVLNDGAVVERETLENDIKNLLREAIGPIALLKKVYIVEDLPKTRSGKIMRRVLRNLFTGEDLGDLSTLANPEVVEKIKEVIKNQ